LYTNIITFYGYRQEIAIGKIEARRNIQCKRVIRLPGSPLGKVPFNTLAVFIAYFVKLHSLNCMPDTFFCFLNDFIDEVSSSYSSSDTSSRSTKTESTLGGGNSVSPLNS